MSEFRFLFRRFGERLPWTFGPIAHFQHLVWDTGKLLGISKTELRDRAAAIGVSASGVKDAQKRAKTELEASAASIAVSRFDKTKSDGLIKPEEAERRIRFLDETYLNSEFDTLSYLMPNRAVGSVFGHLGLQVSGQEWLYYGNCMDVIYSYASAIGINTTQSDGMFFSPDGLEAVASELKIDAKVSLDQAVKYVWLFAGLLDRGIMPPGTKCTLMLIGTSKLLQEAKDVGAELVQQALCDGSHPSYKKFKMVSREALASVLRDFTVQRVTWQQFGKALHVSREVVSEETYDRLVDGFLWALEHKFSQRTRSRLYSSENREAESG